MGCQQEQGDNDILGGVKLTLPALLEFSVNFNDGSFIAFLVGWGFFVTSETQAGMNPALDFRAVFFGTGS